jgi:colanic acid biosynthesis glycosyl transferase WcaI
MRIVLADYSGHAFPAELSRELARRGHEVLHLYFAEFQSPKGGLSMQLSDPVGLVIEPITLGRPFAKHDLIRRRGQEIEVGRRFAARITSFDAEVVVGCNMPLDTIYQVQCEAARHSRYFIFWQQDIYSVAIANLLGRKLGLIGRLIGLYYRSIEGKVLRASDAVVVISQNFVDYLRSQFRVEPGRAHVVENWASLEQITPRPKDNPWSRKHGLADKSVVLYSGTLGMKHDPELILKVAEGLRDRVATEVIVTSEGPTAEWLQEQARVRRLPIRVMGFQPFVEFPDVLASADVVLAILESDSGAFCVPSKVLSYLCAGRPIAMSGPFDNRSASILNESGGGIVVAPGDGQALAELVRTFLDDPLRARAVGSAGRTYAQAHFNVAEKADQFEVILQASRAQQTGNRMPCVTVDPPCSAPYGPRSGEPLARQENI